ncbi:hypothetical protein Tsubulata_016860 [Turnera subulata]|uniref:DNA polymerase alpha subunit B n=1 Tax=Turnera subulata TaxID=218843 RepID=A0A9Q0FZ92_9ROSI|nr:hypothetical protein Tsubulata_016860 [Turnera subulata]
MEEEIKAEFSKSGFSLDEEEEVLKKCLAFCINYNLKPSDLVSSWEVYYLNRQLDESVVRNGEMDGFLLHLQNEQKEMVIKEEPNLHVYSSKDVEMILNDEEGDAKEEIPSTPGDKSLKLQWESSDSALKPHGSGYSTVKSKLVTPFGRRTEKLVEKFSISNLPDSENGENDNAQEISEDDIIKRVQQRKRCSLTLNGSGPEPGCRFMYDRIEDRFNALDNRIKKHAAALSASGFYEEPTDPTVASQRNVFTVGMICCDGEGRLNDKSILLQSSSELSGGRNVRLDVTKLSQFSIFPGQIVGIEGQNPSGHCFIASKLVDSVPLSDCGDENLPPAKRQAFDQEFQSADLSSAQDQTLSALIASGPFTTSDNLLFEPFKELLAYASRKLPQLLILLGPFIDSDHPEISKGTTDRSFEDIFHHEIIKSPAFDINLPNLKHQVISLTNPGSFEANQASEDNI